MVSGWIFYFDVGVLCFSFFITWGGVRYAGIAMHSRDSDLEVMMIVETRCDLLICERLDIIYVVFCCLCSRIKVAQLVRR